MIQKVSFQRFAITPIPPFIRQGEFTLHGGQKSRFKFDCDALSDLDWDAAAAWLAELLPPFASVEGVPRGGLKLAEALRRYKSLDPGVCPHYHVICDDVLTTGGSMEAARAHYVPDGDTFPTQKLCLGAVLIARGPCPSWVVPLLRAPGA